MPTDPPPSVRPSLAPPSTDKLDRGPEARAEATRGERRALGWAALAALVVVAWIMMPVGVGILLGTLLAFTLQPLFETLKPRLGERWSALTIVVGSVLALAGVVGGLSWLLIAKGSTLMSTWTASLGPRGPAGAVFGAVGSLTGRFGVPPD
jgi:hypothetical protein